jgi:putative phage-type endonuclease
VGQISVQINRCSPWQTPYQLWLLRTGRAEQKVTPPMRRGSELEPAARAAYEQHTGNIMEPLVMVDGEYSASLDGITLAGDLALEIKVPFNGRDSELWKAVESGQVPDYYGWQIEHQLMVSGAKLAHLWIYGSAQGLLLEVTPRPERWSDIHKAWDKFMLCLTTDTPPALAERDTRVRDDPAWRNAATRYLAAKEQSEVSAAALDTAKAALVTLASHASESGCGVSVTQYWRRGMIEYKRVPARLLDFSVRPAFCLQKGDANTNVINGVTNPLPLTRSRFAATPLSPRAGRGLG